MTGAQPGFERRVYGAIEAAPSRIPVVLGGCGTGRTWLMQRLRDRGNRVTAQYIDVERCATTPERFLQAVTSQSPFPWHHDGPQPETARQAFDALLAFFDSARAPGGEPCTFLLDEVLELRTFESFPGLRHVLRDLLAALRKDRAALRTFEEFSPSHRREYVEWILEAKREETRARRIETAVEWMAQGRGRDWKYKG